jgi:hypothetical protein
VPVCEPSVHIGNTTGSITGPRASSSIRRRFTRGSGVRDPAQFTSSTTRSLRLDDCWLPRCIGANIAHVPYVLHDYRKAYPAMIREACAADLLGAPACAHGMAQHDPIRVDGPEHGRGGQENLGPVLMRHEEAKEVGPLGYAGKQGTRVSRQAARARPVPHACERMQQPQGDHLSGPEASVRVFG